MNNNEGSSSNINNNDNYSSRSSSSSISNDSKKSGSLSSKCDSDENVQNIVLSVTESYLKDSSLMTSVSTAVAFTGDEIKIVNEISSHQQDKLADKVIDVHISKVDTVQLKDIIPSSPSSSPSSSTPTSTSNHIEDGDALVISEEPEIAGFESFIIPPGHVWLSGDNKTNSTDSR